MKSILKIRTRILIVIQIALILYLSIVIFYSNLFAFPIGLFIIFLLYDLRSKTDRVTIDAEGVTFYNWLTVEKRQFRYEDFDQIVLHRESRGYFNRADVYLLKGRDLICKISGHNYENWCELISEIEQRKSRKN